MVFFYDGKDTIVSTDEVLNLVELADLYASKCSKQEEKFDYYLRNGLDVRWVDCEAAYDLIRELSHYWFIVEAWRKGKYFQI